MEEYYPEEFEKLKEYVAQGRWNVTGSAYENGDVNIPSPEALFRNILYGNSYLTNVSANAARIFSCRTVSASAGRCRALRGTQTSPALPRKS